MSVQSGVTFTVNAPSPRFVFGGPHQNSAHLETWSPGSIPPFLRNRENAIPNILSSNPYATPHPTPGISNILRMSYASSSGGEWDTVRGRRTKIEFYYNVSINIKKLFSFGNSFYKFIETISFWK